MGGGTAPAENVWRGFGGIAAAAIGASPKRAKGRQGAGDDRGFGTAQTHGRRRALGRVRGSFVKGVTWFRPLGDEICRFLDKAPGEFRGTVGVLGPRK